MSLRVSSFQVKSPLMGDEIVGLADNGVNYRTTTGEIAAMTLVGAAESQVASMLLLMAVPNPVGGNALRVTEPLRGGYFVFYAGDMSAFVNLDPYDPITDTGGGIYRAPNSDLTGVSGVWVRQLERQSLCPTKFGAKFDVAVGDDTAAWQATVDTAAALGLPIEVTNSGTSYVICGALDHLYGPTSSNTKVYIAVHVNYSNLKIDLGNCTVRVQASDADTGSRLHYMFGTDKNMTIGDLTDIQICNGTIDVNPVGVVANTPNPRGFYLVGVDGILLDDIKFTSSGTKNGSGMSLQNSRNIRISRHEYYNITQGANFSYIENIEVDEVQFDTFTEAYDFDHRATNGALSNLTFRNALGSDYQCIDLNSVHNFTIKNIVVQDVGNIAYMNYKTTTPPTFAEWVDWVSGVPVSEYTPSKNITIDGVTGDNAGISSTNPFYIGQDQFDSTQTDFPNENLTITNVKLTNTAGVIWVEMSKNFTIDKVRIEGGGVATSSFGAVTVASDFAGFGCSGTIKDSYFKLGATALRGLRCSKPSKLILDNVTIEGNGTDLARFFDFVGLDSNNAQVTVDRCIALLNSDTNCIAWSFGDGAAGPYTYDIKWGEGNRIIGAFTTVFSVNGNTYLYIGKKRFTNLNSLAVTGGTINVPLITTFADHAYVMRVAQRTIGARALDAANYVIRQLQAIDSVGTVSSIQTTSDTAGVTANANDPLITANNRPNVILGADSTLSVAYSKNGTGRTLDGVSLTTLYCDYAVN